MAHKVWCVFQRLPNEKCPTLSAICRTRAVAEAVCESSRRDAEGTGDAESQWTISEWTVLDRRAEHEVDEAAQISHVLDNMRAGVAVPRDGDGEE